MSQNKNNVIEMIDRVPTYDGFQRLNNLKVRFDMEQKKIAVSASLLSILIIVTLANSNLLEKVNVSDKAGGRAIASIPTGTSDAEDSLVQELSRRELSQSATLGHKPSALEKLAFGELEGKYAVRLTNGKIAELEFAKANSESFSGGPKHVANLVAFLESNRDLLPVVFYKSLKRDRQVTDGGVSEVYELVDRGSQPLAKVQFKLDSTGGLLSMSVSPQQIASN